MKLDGKCVVCGCYLGEEAYNRQEVIALIGPEGTVVGCAAHTNDYPGPEFEQFAHKMAEAKAAQFGVFN